jgi:nicotinamidase-related amidase
MKDWSKHALLVVDIQNDFINAIPEPAIFRKNVEELLRLSREQGIHIIHVHACFEPDKSDWMPFALLRGSIPCVRGTQGSNTPQWAAATGSETVIQKRTFDAFLNTGLQDYLDQSGIRHVFLCGLVTSICVNITALSAMQRGFVTTMILDCMSDDPADHDFTLKCYGDFAYNVIERKSIIDSYDRIEEQIQTISTSP